MANTEIPKNSIVVAGYDVTGRITSTENEPLANIFIVLYNPKLVSKKKIDIKFMDFYFMLFFSRNEWS